jgi:hypothetical protein
MHRIGFSLVLLAVVLAPALRAQLPESRIQTAAAVCPPSATLDQLVTALDDAVSGPPDKDRTCLRDLLLPEARLTPVAPGSDGAFAAHILTLDDWIDAVRKRNHTEFFERQVKVQSEVYGHIAHLWSTYEVRPTPDGKAIVRGINSIQAVFDGKRWRIFEVLWQAETPAESLPEKYLP